MQGPQPGDLKQALQASQQAEGELRAREERLRMSLEAANVGAWDWNIRTGEVRWSENLERIHGQAPGIFRGTFEGFLESVHSEDRQSVTDAIQRTLAGSGPYQVEYRSFLPDNSVMWFEGRGHVIRDEAGVPVWMSGICMDATERHRLQDQLRHAQRVESLGLLAAGIAHDFNNLLVGIMGNGSLALDSLPPSAPAAPMLENLLAACERAAQLTRRLLAYAGKDHPAARSLNLTTLVRDVEALLGSSIPKRVRLTLALDESLPPVLADETQLQQVLVNLVINAAEAIPEDTAGVITIGTARRALQPEDHRLAVIPIESPAPEYVELSVRDTGCGMDLQTQARVFDPFFTTKFTGRGLGLSTVLGIAGGHGGTITLQSAPGKGTCFSVLLPAAPGAREPAARGTAAPVRSGSGTILIVDDEPSVLDLTRRVLESHGYQVLLAADGLAAIQQVTEHPEIRAILLDLTMPNMGGDLTAARVRTLRPELPILLSSGYAEPAIKRNSLQTPYSAFLQKPYTARELMEQLGRLLEAG